MDKELPWFKFKPAQWENGNIQLCSAEEKGVFIGVCSMYWQRLGDLPYKLAVQKICGGNATAIDSLYVAGIIKIVDGLICIDFLNEQLSEFENTSQINSENARLGWEKRRNKATALRPQSDPNARREEKSKEEKSKEEKSKEENIYVLAKKSLDEREIETLKMNRAYPGIDIDAQLLQFLEKVRGAPGDYSTHDTAGFRKAFAYQLRNTKPTSSKKSTNDFLNEAIK